MKWISSDDGIPLSMQKVLMVINSGKRRRIVIGEYVRKGELELFEEFFEFGVYDYDEEKDIYYCEEGWYENSHFEGDPILMPIGDHEGVTHWMSIPEKPKKDNK